MKKSKKHNILNVVVIAFSTFVLFILIISYNKSKSKITDLPPEPKQNKYQLPNCLNDIPKPDSRRHIVKPPLGKVTIVCCNSTKGTLNIEVHPTWAPNGAKRFLEMVQSDFFSTRIGLFRSMKGFIVQFGIAGDPEVHQKYRKAGNLKDDPPWLPQGPSGREINGVKRYQRGYLGYAGAGNNSRQTQLIMAYSDNLYLGGGCPWEVPFAQLLGEASYRTLDSFYTGYGEKPSQGKLMKRGARYLDEEFPLIDFITSCHVTREDIPWEPPTL
jgi:cyclophilin family peptidyl-prolyl cis-trans isomerase